MLSTMQALQSDLTSELHRSVPPRVYIGDLTPTEVAKVLLQGDQELCQLYHSGHEDIDGVSSSEAFDTAVRAWQKQHVRGKAPPFGSCFASTATLLF